MDKCVECGAEPREFCRRKNLGKRVCKDIRNRLAWERKEGIYGVSSEKKFRSSPVRPASVCGSSAD